MTKVGTLSNPADIFTKFVSSETIQRQLRAVGLRRTKFIHAIHAIRCKLSDLVEVCETKAHETRAMAIRNFDITKFLEAEWPKTYYEWDEIWPDPPEITEAEVGVMLDDIDLDFDQRQRDYICEMNTKLHWPIFNDAILPTQIAYRAMTNLSYANGRAKNGCPICARLLTDDYKTYRDVQEMPNDDLTDMIRLVSEPLRIQMTVDQPRRPMTPRRTRTSKSRRSFSN